MNDFFTTGRNWEHTLAIVLLLARFGDLASTYLATPTLRLEANPLARKFGWPFAWLTLLVCFVPYYNTSLAVIAITVSLFATASNLSRAWIIRALGEAEYLNVLQRAAAASRPREAIAFILASSGAFALAGVVLLVISGGPGEWPFWFAVGIIAYAYAMAMFGVVFVRRLYRQSTAAKTVQTE